MCIRVILGEWNLKVFSRSKAMYESYEDYMVNAGTLTRDEAAREHALFAMQLADRTDADRMVAYTVLADAGMSPVERERQINRSNRQ